MESPIMLRPLGKSDLKLTPVGLGCWQFSKRNNFAGRVWPFLEDDVIDNIVHQSLNGGINWFDTAELYGNGASEKSLATALLKAGKKPGEVIIATKWWPMFRTASNIVKTIDTRLRMLDPFPIDLYIVHQPYGFSKAEAEMDAMAELVKAGKIRNIGVSNFSASQMRRAWERLQKHGLTLVSNQVRYSLLDRRIEKNGILETAKELGISIVAYSPLAQGAVTGKFHDHPELLNQLGYRKYFHDFKHKSLNKSRPLINLLKTMALKYNVTPSQIALNWLINYHGETVFVIPGATTEQQVIENAGAMRFSISEEDMRTIEQSNI